MGDCSIIAVDEWMIELPNSNNYSSQVGTLSLGATGTQAFSNVPNYGEVDVREFPPLALIMEISHQIRSVFTTALYF